MDIKTALSKDLRQSPMWGIGWRSRYVIAFRPLKSMVTRGVVGRPWSSFLPTTTKLALHGLQASSTIPACFIFSIVSSIVSRWTLACLLRGSAIGRPPVRISYYACSEQISATNVKFVTSEHICIALDQVNRLLALLGCK